MAFVSMLSMTKKQKYGRNLKAFVRFRMTKVGAAGSFSKETNLRGKRVDIQIDEETGRIRCKEDENGNRVGNINGQFGFSKALVKVLGVDRIYLEPSDDGWWYGSYENQGVTDEQANR